jgi:hyperosmotically inducible protein
MRHHRRALLSTTILAVAVLVTAQLVTAGQPQKQGKEPKAQDLIKEVRHQLVLLPYYSVFDNLTFKVEGSKVILMGQVVRPTLKSDAEAAVKSIEGVSSVENDIEVLPVSPVPSIHIIVKNGNVTLEGVADNETDKNLAGLRANGVPNVFSVKNNLVLAGQGK